MSSTDHHQRQQEAHNRQVQELLQEYVKTYPINLSFPAKVSPAMSEKRLRTNVDLVQHRLLESGVLFDDLQHIGQVNEVSERFINSMMQTGCYHAVQVKLENHSGQEDQSNLHILLNEKNWYSLYIGGGFKQGAIYQNAAGDGVLPKVQFETSGSLLNLTGHLDKTSLSYTVDQTSTATLALTHERPLYSLFSQDSPIHDFILGMGNGSQYTYTCRAMLDTVDHEWTRSYKEYQRLLSMRISNKGNAGIPEMVEGGYSGVDWTVVFRDVIPRRHASLPYSCDASPEVVAQSGPTTKHSVSYEYRMNGSLTNDRFNPTSGVDWHSRLELALPPGDVGFFKAQTGMAGHAPVGSLALHMSASAGILQPLTFGGLCGPPTLSDKFYFGGPLQLRGFLPAGVGPRSKTGGSSTPGGDALGGDLFYSATLAASIPVPTFSSVWPQSNIRLFGFANAGTLTSLQHSPSAWSILKSTRASVGGGVCMGSPFGRMEVTYAVPLRYGPRDARRSVQFGLGFSFG
jgi:outer membrane protein assembly factor BamA